MVNEQVKREKNNQVEQQTREATSYCFSRFSSARLFCVSQEEKNLRIISSTSRKASTTTITALRLLFECGVYKTVIMMFLALWLIGHIHSAHMPRVSFGWAQIPRQESARKCDKGNFNCDVIALSWEWSKACSKSKVKSIIKNIYIILYMEERERKERKNSANNKTTWVYTESSAKKPLK